MSISEPLTMDDLAKLDASAQYERDLHTAFVQGRKPPVRMSNTVTRPPARKPRKTYGSFPLLASPKLMLSLEVDPTAMPAADRFAACFREVWSRLPRWAKLFLIGHWQLDDMIDKPDCPIVALVPDPPKDADGMGTFARYYPGSESFEFPWNRLSKLPDKLVLCAIAHELGHAVAEHMRHLDGHDENTADNLATQWGFPMGEMRDVLGDGKRERAPARRDAGAGDSAN